MSPRRQTTTAHSVSVTNRDKVMYPSTGTTKGEVIDYYRQVAGRLTAHAASRPATLKRWVDGVGTAADPRPGFLQKDVGKAPPWVRLLPVQHADHVNLHVDVRDESTLVWAAQLAALEVHVPQWRADAEGKPLAPDRLVFDLDPGPGTGLRECAQVAAVLRERLVEAGLEAYPVTSGSKGIHLYSPLSISDTAWSASAFARQLAQVVEGDLPGLVVTNMSKAVRHGRVFIDWSQNNPAKTTVCPYSLRGVSTPTVAAPRSWEEIAQADLRHLTMDEVLGRLNVSTRDRREP